MSPKFISALRYWIALWLLFSFYTGRLNGLNPDLESLKTKDNSTNNSCFMEFFHHSLTNQRNQRVATDEQLASITLNNFQWITISSKYRQHLRETSNRVVFSEEKLYLLLKNLKRISESLIFLRAVQQGAPGCTRYRHVFHIHFSTISLYGQHSIKQKGM